MIRGNDINYSLYSKKIYDSLNYIQSTKWKINECLVKKIEADLIEPRYKDFVKITKPDSKPCRWDIDLKDDSSSLTDDDKVKIEEERQKYKKREELYREYVNDYESALGKYRTIKLAINIAKKYIGETIYFPHSFDFRGRVYPIPVGLSPQGSDAVKAMLEYAYGKKLNEQGIKWSWAYLASLYGDDKLPFDKRIERGKELLNADYKDADEPYQFLAHQLEMKKFLENPNHEFKARIHLDACNSGSQFTSAITGDIAGCKATNVIPTFDEDGNQDRQDAYLLVADYTIDLIEDKINDLEFKINVKGEFEHEEKLNKLKDLKDLLIEHGRKICKIPVMISSYGSKVKGRKEAIWDIFRELNVDFSLITKNETSILSGLIDEATNEILKGGKAFENYIQKMNSLLTKENKAITWETSDGFVVKHLKYKYSSKKQITLKLPISKKQINIYHKVLSKKIDSTKMKNSISPNYIHSLDAELLRRVALRMKEAGIEDSDWIHDSFGCHPNQVDLMLSIAKEEFKEMIKSNPLKGLHYQLLNQINNESTKESVKNIVLPYNSQFDAEKELNMLNDSEWFFS